MRTKDFETAIAANGCEILRISFRADSGGNVKTAYGHVIDTLTYVKWDETGRAFVYVHDEKKEESVNEENLGLLPYERDPKFDLKFE